MNAAAANAKRLVEGAEALLKADRHASATALAILAIEEVGKISILRSIVLSRDDQERVAAWKEYRSHTKKNVAWLLPQLVSQGARTLEDFRSLFDVHSDHPYVLDQVKQVSIYTDCLGRGIWSVPKQAIDLELASSLVQTARLSIPNEDVTAEEVELWVKHLGPVWETDIDCMKRALQTWYEEVTQRGLKSESGYENFI